MALTLKKCGQLSVNGGMPFAFNMNRWRIQKYSDRSV
jgi:hypothetical protein